MKFKTRGLAASFVALVVTLSMAQSVSAGDWPVQRVYVKEAHIFKKSGTTVMRVVYEADTNSCGGSPMATWVLQNPGLFPGFSTGVRVGFGLEMPRYDYSY